MPTSVVEAVDSLDEATDWEPIFNNGDRLRQQTKEQAGGSWAQIAAQRVRAMLGKAGLLAYNSDGPMADRQEKVVGRAGSVGSDACQEPDFSLLTWTWRERCTTEEVGGRRGGGNLVLANCLYRSQPVSVL